VGNGEGVSPPQTPADYVWGSVVSSPNAPAENKLGAFQPHRILNGGAMAQQANEKMFGLFSALP